MKDTLTPVEMQAVDKNTQYNKIPTLVLMENAGARIAGYIKENYPDKKRVSVYAGSGGNGGDGLVTARHLLNMDYRVDLKILTRPGNIRNKDTRTNYESIQIIAKTDSNLKLTVITDSAQLTPDNSDIIVDAILGTGISTKLRQPVSKAVDIINYSPAPVLSVDIPTGLNPLDGTAADKQVIPETTLTLHKPKTGLVKAPESYTGEVKVLDIGIPKVSELYTGCGDLVKIRKPVRNSHKTQNGSVLIIGSNSEYTGAVVFAANAALTQNIDLVYIAVPEKSADTIKQYNPEFIVIPLPSDKLTPEGYDKIEQLTGKADAILVGPGAGLDPETGELFNRIIKSAGKPVVIDADALKLVDKENIRNKNNVVLTPHANEFRQFFKVELPEKFDRRVTTVRDLAGKYGVTILLKGVTDIIACNDDYKLNSAGNQGMTKGGTGDMLAGLITALITKTDTPYDAAYIASFILTAAADKAQQEAGINYRPGDIFKYM